MEDGRKNLITKVKNDYIFGLDEIRNKVFKYCKVLINNDEKFKIVKRRLTISPTFLFYGYPGTGKTTLANEIYEMLKQDENYGNIDKYILRIDELLSSNFGESSKNLISRFEKIKLEIEKNNSIAFIIIDELDFFTNNRFQNNNDSVVRVLLTFNQIIDNLIRKNLIDKMIIIATTNIRENIDTSILRRFFFHQNFNIILDKKKFSSYLEELCNITGLEKIENFDELYNIYTEKQFTLGELKAIFSNVYMERKIDLETEKDFVKIFLDNISYNETMCRQQGVIKNE